MPSIRAASLTTTRPAEPLADLKARAAAAVDAARDEIIDLSHRIHATPEPNVSTIRFSADAPERCTNPMPAFAVTSVKTTCESGFACAAASSGTISAVPAIATAVPLVMTVS